MSLLMLYCVSVVEDMVGANRQNDGAGRGEEAVQVDSDVYPRHFLRGGDGSRYIYAVGKANFALLGIL